MGPKLTNSDIEYLATSIDGVLRPYYNRKIEVVMKREYYGEKAARILNSTYGAEIQNVGGWKEFDMKFDSMSARDEVLAEVNSSIVNWRNQWIHEHQEEYVEGGLPDAPSPSQDDNTGNVGNQDTGNTNKKKDWVTYLVIGAAAVVIILMLWDRKRK